ncbi:hypothetical protein JXM67_03530 [candidate division WOR-3 bacterium]|nr:hypothetical protein [candidate division WOR-3 bacterium]
MKIDTAGDTVWTKFYGHEILDFIHGLSETEDRGFIATGFVDNNATWKEGNVWVLRFDSLGDTLWTRAYGGENYDQGTDAIQTSEGNYMVLASTRSFGEGGADIWLLNLDESGDTAWSKTFGGVEDDNGAEIIPVDDGGCILVGRTQSLGSVNMDAYIVKSLLQVMSSGSLSLEANSTILPIVLFLLQEVDI